MELSVEERRGLIEAGHPELSVRRQCELLEVARSGLYYRGVGEGEENLELMRLLDEQYTRTPFYGIRRMTAWLRGEGWEVNVKRVRRLLRVMGLEAIGPKPNTSRATPGHRIYPYLLRNVEITRVNQVWSSDITYLPMRRGFAYLTAVMDWHSRYVLAWEVSVTMETDFCVRALERALRLGTPEIFNTDQGAQFTSAAFTSRLAAAGVQISMDGRGRAFDNIFIERLWRSVKYEDVYPHDYETVPQTVTGLDAYFTFYDHERVHQSLGYRTPAAVFFGKETGG